MTAPRTARLFLAKCLDCKKEYASTGMDALCIACRVANTARNLMPGSCPKCGRPLERHKYRWPTCSDCQRAETATEAKRFGAE